MSLVCSLVVVLLVVLNLLLLFVDMTLVEDLHTIDDGPDPSSEQEHNCEHLQDAENDSTSGVIS